jgi:putative transposase
VLREFKNQPVHLISGFHSRNTLPHRKREGATYFVTFRLAGTLPSEVIAKLKAEREAILQKALFAKRPLNWREQEELFIWYSKRVDNYLDSGKGECFLKLDEIADLVARALKYFAGDRYELSSWVIMPNHVHVVVKPNGSHSLSKILQSWKSFTAKEANRILNRTGAFWQKESYDHLVRDDHDLARCRSYTTMNPVNARLCSRPEDWRWSSLYAPQHADA